MKATVKIEEATLPLSVWFIAPNYINVATLAPADAFRRDDRLPAIAWSDLVAKMRLEPTGAYAAGYRDTSHKFSLVTGVPGLSEDVSFLGMISVALPGSFGLDEFGDQMILDVLIGDDRAPVAVVNRLATSQLYKATNPKRVRAIDHGRGMKLASLVSPFKPTDLTKLALVEVCYNSFRPILIDGAWDSERPNVGYSSRLMDGLWSVAGTNGLSVNAGDALTFPIQLIWNDNVDFEWTGGTECAHEATLQLSADCGYLPKTRIVTDSHGKASISVRALDLAQGDIIKLKIGSGYNTKVGAFEIAVV
ncbi:hypothetical protein UFOVP32_21 [uncultured Caudovirales phage]|uniref:Uncharacterized protein n=1 Tax=uncultured Caudovirales phage TaxID=2100421 RepID=A0A6J5KNI6_9CAUD|nr:hypothetical protein UFOVP32_21 [uncultured Caudovirales phage]CAB4123751.1 hypothetical protein UFOVP50_55 [uncultured Caudovirales phage]